MQNAPRVAAVHDMSGFGRCSLTVILPVLSALGVQCCPIPTAYLSAHTAFPPSEKATFVDLAGQMAGTTEHWKELGITFAAIYSGFLGSVEQIGLLEQLIDQFRGEQTLVLVDPVMGDNGVPYRTYTHEMCEKMVKLSENADIITPNLTEAALLLGEDYANVPQDEAGIRGWLERLSMGHRRSVVLTGVHLAAGQIGGACLDRADGSVSFAMDRLEAGHFPGTGDLFASVVLGTLLAGETLAEGNRRAVHFVRDCAARTLAMGTPAVEGVEFEGLLGQLTGGRTGLRQTCGTLL